jgi:hypothetical protein
MFQNNTNQVHRLPLINGGFALIDDDFVFNIVKEMKWKFWNGKGVVSYDKKQAILLHNMIAPYNRVSFINNNKKDCRKSNLIPFIDRNLYTNNLPIGKLIYDNYKKRQVEFRVSIRRNGKTHTYIKSFSYNIRTKKDAITKARISKEQFISMSKQQKLDVLINNRNNRKPRGKLIYDYKRDSRFDIRRSVMIAGKTYTASISLYYKDRPQRTIKKTAIKIRRRFADMSTRKFAQWTLTRPRWKPSVNEMVREWSGYNDHEAKYREIKDMNISYLYDKK